MGYRRRGIQEKRKKGIKEGFGTGKQGSGQEGCGTVEMLERRDTGMEGGRKGEKKERRDEGKKGYMKVWIQD